MAKLTLSDLLVALDKFAGRYHAIDVFADDLREIDAWRTRGQAPEGWRLFDAENHRFLVDVGGRPLEVQLFDRMGVVRVARAEGAIAASMSPATGALGGGVAGGLAGAAIGAATSQKGEAWTPGLILGLLVGAAVGSLSAPPGATSPPRRVFTLSFDPKTGTWLSYDGGLVPWMKSTLLTSAA